MGVLIDTCVWIDVERGRLGPADVAAITGDEPVYLSPVSLAELRFGAENAASAELRQKRLSALQRLRSKPCLRIDANTGEVFGALAVELRRAGRGHEFRVQDIWLASQAIQQGYALLTRNEKDFRDIPGLDLLLV